MENKTVKLKDFNVEISNGLNWGQKEKLQSELVKGAKINDKGFQEFDTEVILKVKYKTAELLIQNIKDKDGKDIEYSNDWLNNLSVEDGDKLMEELDVISNISKKKE